MFFKRSNIEYIIAGLGNPGRRYAGTRHNAGFWMLDSLSQRYGIDVSRNRFNALCGDGRIGSARVLLIKPMAYMNLSGNSLTQAARFYKVPPDNILVLCDDVTLPPGVVRIRREGSSGGHNGLRSLIDCLGTTGFPRIRIGVGERAHSDTDLADWVTGVPSSGDAELIKKRSSDVCEAVELIVNSQFDLAQSRYNG